MNESDLGFALLGLLDQEPRSGYDLRKVFTLTPFNHFSDSPGAIYPALRRLGARGWVAAEDPAGGRRRQVFRLTPKGRQAWTAWLRELPEAADVVTRLDRLLLRFAFMGGVLEPAAAERYLEALQRSLEAHVAELRRYRAESMQDVTVTGRLAFESGLESYEARLEWARRARAQLRRKGRT
ncbi:MAG TPA: PadR family transcriptional regulator [Vicinamibacteria bacterium]|nr:PadR family transcriptional regulator [Vicinamibacteria bacterium]